MIRRGVDGEEVLLQLRRSTGYMDGHWAAGAAGHVERGETAYDAVRREAREELGVIDVDLEFAFTMHRTQHGAPIDERVDFFFTSRAWRGQPKVREPAKTAELRWWPLTALPAAPDRLVPHERYALESLGRVGPYLTYGFDRETTT